MKAAQIRDLDSEEAREVMAEAGRRLLDLGISPAGMICGLMADIAADMPEPQSPRDLIHDLIALGIEDDDETWGI